MLRFKTLLALPLVVACTSPEEASEPLVQDASAEAGSAAVCPITGAGGDVDEGHGETFTESHFHAIHGLEEPN